MSISNDITIGELRVVRSASTQAAPHKSMEGARAMASRGFRVFPLKPNSKLPAIAEWQKLATTDAVQIEKWEKQFPQANYGVVADNHIFVDPDVKNSKPGLENVAKLKLPQTYTIETPTGGQHLYFKAEAPVMSGANVHGDGVDIKSGHAAYVVGPGSVINGAPYKVINKLPIAAAPPVLTERRAALATSEPAKTAIATDPDRAVERAKAFLETYPAALEGNGGDERTLFAAQRCRDEGVPQSRCAEAMAGWNDRCAPPWAPDDLAVKIANAYRYAKDRQGHMSPEGMFGPVEPPQPANDVASAVEPLRVLRPAEVTLDQILDTSNDLIPGVLSRNSIACIFGKWGTGKTFLALSLGAHIVGGQAWGLCDVEKGGVLIFSYEGDIGMAKRLWALRQHFKDIGWDRAPFEIVLISEAIIRPEGNKQAQEAINNFRTRYGQFPALIVVDPLRDALGASDSDPDNTAPYIRWARKVRVQTKACVLSVTHTGHSDQTRARGDSGLPAAWDTEISLDGDVMEIRKQRDDAKLRFGYHLETMQLGINAKGRKVTSCVAVYRDIKGGPVDGKNAKVLEIASVLAERGPFNRIEVSRLSGMDKKEFDAAWRALKARSLVIPKGKAWVLGDLSATNMFGDDLEAAD